MEHLKKYRNRILIVDDEPVCLLGVRQMLHMCSVDIENVVDVAMNGEEATKSVQAAIELGFSYNLILTDISMPVMDGFEASKKIRQILDDQLGPRRSFIDKTNIIGVTGHIEKHFVNEAYKAGID